jgi:choline dehydrogenase-like flavoprotein
MNKFANDSRSSSLTSYLAPVESERTLWTTLTGQLVTKILFKPSKLTPLTATGIEFGTANGTLYKAYAKREVIVAAGTIGVSIFIVSITRKKLEVRTLLVILTVFIRSYPEPCFVTTLRSRR